MAHTRGKVDLSTRLKFGVGRGMTTKKITSAIASFALLLTLSLGSYNLWVLKSPSPVNPRVLSESDGINNTPENVLYYTHSVVKGETLAEISNSYHISETALAAINNLQPPYTLKSGSVLRIPKD